MRTTTPLSRWRALLAGAWAIAVLTAHPSGRAPAPGARASAADTHDVLRDGTCGHGVQPSLAADGHVTGDAGRGDGHGAGARSRPVAAVAAAPTAAWRRRAQSAGNGVSVLRTAPKTSPPV